MKIGIIFPPTNLLFLLLKLWYLFTLCFKMGTNPLLSSSNFGIVHLVLHNG
jgi:hypothetical protein